MGNKKLLYIIVLIIIGFITFEVVNYLIHKDDIEYNLNKIVDKYGSNNSYVDVSLLETEDKLLIYYDLNVLSYPKEPKELYGVFECLLYLYKKTDKIPSITEVTVDMGEAGWNTLRITEDDFLSCKIDLNIETKDYNKRDVKNLSLCWMDIYFYTRPKIQIENRELLSPWNYSVMNKNIKDPQYFFTANCINKENVTDLELEIDNQRYTINDNVNINEFFVGQWGENNRFWFFDENNGLQVIEILINNTTEEQPYKILKSEEIDTSQMPQLFKEAYGIHSRKLNKKLNKNPNTNLNNDGYDVENPNLEYENNINYESWMGSYTFSEYENRSVIKQIIEVEIYRENGDYVASVLLTKAHDKTYLIAKLSGNKNSLDIICDEVIYSDSNPNFKKGDVLFSINNVNENFEADWGKVTNLLSDNQNVFTKLTYEDNIAEKNEETKIDVDYAQNLENLDNWVGEYEYYSFIPPNINQNINMKIFKEDDVYVGKLVEEGFQVWNDFDVKVVGTTNEIFILYANNNTENQQSIYEEDDVLVCFKRQDNGTLLTYWGEITPYLLENQENGFEYFTKVK